MGKVIALEQVAPETALGGLNRVTGLSFSRWPESLVNPAHSNHAGQADAEVQAKLVTGDLAEGQQQKNPLLAAEA